MTAPLQPLYDDFSAAFTTVQTGQFPTRLRRSDAMSGRSAYADICRSGPYELCGRTRWEKRSPSKAKTGSAAKKPKLRDRWLPTWPNDSILRDHVFNLSTIRTALLDWPQLSIGLGCVGHHVRRRTVERDCKKSH